MSQILTSEQILAMQQQLAALRIENERLKSAPKSSGGLKISAKGALSYYGLGRFPVTLYKSQWNKLLANADTIQKFLNENDQLLAEKGLA